MRNCGDIDVAEGKDNAARRAQWHMLPAVPPGVAHDVAGIERAWKKMGCTMPSPFMTMGLLSLACIPELRLTDRGLVDCCRYCFVPLLVEDEG